MRAESFLEHQPNLVSLLSYHELFEETAKLAYHLVTLFLKTNRYRAIAMQAVIMGALAESEVLVAKGSIQDAIRLLETITNMESQRHDDVTQESANFVDPFSLAQEFATHFAGNKTQ